MLAHFGELHSVYPATKEQRDILFQKMKEEGYEWNAEKKKLIEIEKQSEHKSDWSEEDEKMLTSTIEYLNEFREVYQKGAQECIAWLKSIKERYTWKPSKEQMEALFEAKLASIKNREYFLGTLYEDLKKI